MKALIPDTQLRPGQVASMIGISYQTLYTWGNAGKGPRFSLSGRERRYRLEDVVAWLENRESGGEK
jgi:predicted site-specific integrase-resolvase